VFVADFDLPLILSQLAASAAVSMLSFIAYRRIFVTGGLLPDAVPRSHGGLP